MTTTKKNPPMAKAIRDFVAGMQFPPAPKHGPNPNIDLAAFIISMLQHSTGLKENATTATCSPALSQMADMLHCTNSSIERRLQRLRALGLLTQRGRGHASTIYTFHQTPQLLLGQETATVAGSESSQRPQLLKSAPATQISAPATPDSAPATVADLRGKASGVEPQEKQKPSGVTIGCGGSSSGRVQTTDPFAAMREQIHGRPQ